MSLEFRTHGQAMTAIRTWFLDFTDELPQGVTLVNASALHVPPVGGTPTTPVTIVQQDTQVWMTLGPVNVLGNHVVFVTYFMSDGEQDSIKLVVPVSY